VTFTGSTEVGKILLRQAAENVQKCSMELGGNAPLIVFEDADFDLAIRGALATKYRNCGQTASPPTAYWRMRASRGLSRSASPRRRAAQGRRWSEEGAVIGPLIEQAAVEKCERHVADAVARGAALLTAAPAMRSAEPFFSRRCWPA